MRQLGTRVSDTTYMQKQRLQKEADFTVREILTLGIGMLYEATFGQLDRAAILEAISPAAADKDPSNGD